MTSGLVLDLVLIGELEAETLVEGLQPHAQLRQGSR